MEEENDKWCDRNCWANKGRLYRYFALVNICFLGLGAFVCFDSPGALQEALMSTFDINFSEFSLVYSVNSWPNVVLSFFGGVLIDRVFGIKLGTLLYSGMCAVGHMIFSLGVLINVYWCALLGRLLAGIGSEVLYLSIQLYSFQYFIGKELSMVMCISVSISRLGSSLVYAISKPILNNVRELAPGNHDVGIVLFIVGSFIFVTLFGASVLACMNPRSRVQNLGEKKEKTKKSLNWRNLILFPLEFWLVLMIQLSFSVTIYVFLPYTQDFFKSVHGMSVESANQVTSYFSLVGAVIAPFIGIVIDKLGRALVFSKVALVAGLIAHIILGFTAWSPYLSIFILSLSYGFFNGSVAPMFAYIVPEHKLGTAYGLVLAAINGAYALTVYLAGVILDKYSYRGLEIFMLAFIAFGFISSVALWIEDRKGPGILNMTPSERNIYFEKLKESDELKEPLKDNTVGLK